MSRNPLQERLISIVEPVCEAAGYELVDLRFLLEQGGWVLRVQIDRPLDDAVDPSEVPTDRVDLEACENLSRELSAVLDVDDPIPQAYSLEVSSPGIDRPLRTARHFQYFTGSEAKIQLAVGLATPSGERRNFRGFLRGIDGDKVLIDVDGQRFELPIADIDHAKLVPDWDAVMHGKSGIGAPEPKPVKPGHRPSKKKTKSPKPASAREDGSDRSNKND
ncbi:MAG TPA: ribosome maturation factor RimP [Kofleriaceae bacterium]|nr:ribosome maturation factor RimP [Kofleriaceae bacterium]